MQGKGNFFFKGRASLRREGASDSQNWQLGFTFAGRSNIDIVMFLKSALSHELPRCPRPAVWQSA